MAGEVQDMNTRTLCISIITSLALSPFAIGSSDTNVPPPAATATEQASQAKASSEVEPTEAEMRAAVQRHLDSINSQMRPPPAPSTSSSNQPRYIYSPYWRYYGHGYGYKYSPDSNYENWTDVAKRAHATARVEITSFKKIRCTPEPEEGGFSADYIAELELRGASNPVAQDIMQTSGKRLKGFFYKGDKGWIFGEAPTETK
jgi:hypothetical protein